MLKIIAFALTMLIFMCIVTYPIYALFAPNTLRYSVNEILGLKHSIFIDEFGIEKGTGVDLGKNRSYNTPISFVSIISGNIQSCALDKDGKPWCWLNSASAPKTMSKIPAKPSLVEITGKFTKIALGDRLACALKTDGTIWCWGDSNYFGPLTIPSPVIQNERFKDISIHRNVMCSINLSGKASCWGTVDSKLDYGLNADKSQIIPVSSSVDFSYLSTGQFKTCALDVSGSAWCWRTPPWTEQKWKDWWSTPKQVKGHSFKQISVGADHVCGLKTDSSIWCWGNNGNGQLGTASTKYALDPVRIQTNNVLFNFVSTGEALTCALSSDSELMCWGAIETQSIKKPKLPTVISDKAKYKIIDSSYNVALGLSSRE